MAMTKEQLEAKVAELEEKNRALEEEKERREQLEQAASMQTEQLRAVLGASKHTITPYRSTEKTKIKLPKDNFQYKDPLYVCINGRNVVIQRGVTVEIDKYIADFIEQMERDQEANEKKADQQELDYERNTREVAR